MKRIKVMLITVGETLLQLGLGAVGVLYAMAPVLVGAALGLSLIGMFVLPETNDRAVRDLNTSLDQSIAVLGTNTNYEVPK